jgi:hypothetical protein
MQACLARLYTDDVFRNLFYLDQNTVLDRYVLTDDECIAIKGINQKMLNFFASSLKEKRKKRIRSAYQALFRLNNEIIHRCYNRYYELYPVRSALSQQDEILQFGQFMEETFTGFDALPLYARDLARYEHIIASMSLPQFFEKRDSRPRKERREILSSDRPAIREGVDVETFVYNVAAIHEALLNNEEPQEINPGEYYILFLRNPSFGPKYFSISHGTKTLLDRCDGNITLREVVDKLQMQYGDNSLTNSILALTNQLLVLGIIKVKFHEEYSSTSS